MRKSILAFCVLTNFVFALEENKIEDKSIEKDKEIERLNRLIGRLQNEMEELKKGSAQTENPVECANAV